MYASGLVCLTTRRNSTQNGCGMSPGTSSRKPSTPLLGSPPGASQRFTTASTCSRGPCTRPSFSSFLNTGNEPSLVASPPLSQAMYLIGGFQSRTSNQPAYLLFLPFLSTSWNAQLL